MQIERVPVDSVAVAPRHRAADPAKVKQIAESMKLHGQLQPITVHQPDEYSCELIAGLHRLEAARSLGWENVEAVFIEADSINREMIEIAENLHRCDLSVEERNRQIRRYAELKEQRRASGISTQDAAKMPEQRGRGRPRGVIAEVAREVGLSEDTVRRAINPPAPKPSAPSAPEPRDLGAKQFEALMAAWEEAGQGVRERFMAAVNLVPPPSPPSLSPTPPISPPLPPTSPLSARESKSLSARQRASRLPLDFCPPPETWALAQTLGYTLEGYENATANFRDHFASAPGQRGVKLDWTATHRVWIRRDAPGGQPGASGQRAGANRAPTGSIVAGAAIALAALAAEDRAGNFERGGSDAGPDPQGDPAGMDRGGVEILPPRRAAGAR